jgi:hypothetical protein
VAVSVTPSSQACAMAPRGDRSRRARGRNLI